MKPDHHTAIHKISLIKRLSLAALLCVFLIPAYSQNTKGDQPAKPSREAKFKSKSKKKTRSSGKRVSPKGKSWGSSASKGPSEKGRAWSGDITGRKIPATRSKNKRTRIFHPQSSRTVTGAPGNNDDSYRGGGRPPKRISPRSSSSRARNVYPQKGPYVAKKRPPSKGDTPLRVRGTSSYQKARSVSGKNKNVFPQRGPYVTKTRPPSRGDNARNWRGSTGSRSNARSSSQKNNNVFPQRGGQFGAKTKPPARGDNPIRWTGSTVAKQKIRSATGKSKNVFPQRGRYALKTRPPSRGDSPQRWKGSVSAGGKVRSATGQTRNVFRQKGLYVSNPSVKPPNREKPPGKRLKPAPVSASKPFIRHRSINPFAGFWNNKPKKEKAFVGDISGKRLRSRNYETPRQPAVETPLNPYLKRKRVGETPYSGKASGSYKTATRSARAWQGDISGRKLRDRNRSSKGPTEAGKPLLKLPFTGDARVGVFTGRMKYRKPLKGGGSVSGKLWNNEGKPLIGRAPRTGSRAAAFQGNMKAQRTEPSRDVGGIPRFRGGSHVTMRIQGEDFTGHTKARKPAKGGGSVSGKLWNNNERPLIGKAPGIGAKAGYFSGNIKAKKPDKGGGSVSGKLWNNKERPLTGRGPKGSDLAIGNFQGRKKVNKEEPSTEVGGFPGKYRMFDLHPSMRNQGEEYTGNIRRSKLKNDYIQNPNSSKEALKKMQPSKSTFLVDGLQIRVKQQDYKKKPNAADGSQPGIAPGKSSIKASEYARVMKRDWRYIENKSAADEAQKVREPGKAFGKVTDYQGNVKMKKYDLFGKKNLHPDAQFVKTNKNNVKEEKNIVTNFKLLWARWFKKSDTQPDHLKEKIRKPRYDKGEVGLWYN